MKTFNFVLGVVCQVARVIVMVWLWNTFLAPYLKLGPVTWPVMFVACMMLCITIIKPRDIEEDQKLTPEEQSKRTTVRLVMSLLITLTALLIGWLATFFI